MSNRLIFPPPSELLSVADVQKHSRIDSDSEAEWAVASLLPVAIEEVQTYCNVQLLSATREETLTAFPCGREPLKLPYRPLHAIVSIKYRATDGTLTTWDAAEYEAERGDFAAWVRPAYSYTWPIARNDADGVQIRYVCGWPNVESIPQHLLHAVRMTVTHLYEIRDSVVVGTAGVELPMTVKHLLGRHDFNLVA